MLLRDPSPEEHAPTGRVPGEYEQLLLAFMRSGAPVQVVDLTRDKRTAPVVCAGLRYIIKAYRFDAVRVTRQHGTVYLQRTDTDPRD